MAHKAQKSALRRADERRNALFVLPMAAFAVLFVALPLLYVLGTSLVVSGEKFSFGAAFTLDNYKKLLRADYLKVFFNSMKLALETTLVCLLIGYPFGYFMARSPKKWKALLMMLVIIPFWTSALVRIYGWKILLQANGPINAVLKGLGLIEKNIKVLGSYGSVLLAMVYCMISFMILPCHSAVDKMDFTLVEAARDLGSSPARAFVDVTLPLTMPGILAGCVLVFVPSVGIFYLADIMGGGLVLVGNLIRDQLLKVRDWNTGSAMSMVLILLTAGIYLVYRRSGGDDLGVF
ncbi:MAG: ABC transporter permease [Clostridia bacterium]|nr:ABC transporter permease [Clostridia bacterium]